MRTALRVVLCVCLMALAAVMAGLTAADLTREKPAPEERLYLGAWEGSVAIFDGSGAGTPRSVTDIELASLRAADRALIEHGCPVAGEEALQALLEDLGS